ncbi:MutS protein msh4 [Friedmanniomyces endolithicus]|uniref:MutS protein msh4 n=1 Tax=Friedmanniomyces endolithicus TaxID=329885 RepID=A0AAN6FNR3_9PEZI|nr:MutS protein msh4 [Friedmanniomyces endolithicus]KAK0297047.1 MutS protein msh4 [Friedmanniomyces endolithicus]KAK0320743.1 MutS protein msh4 [Friedmanniomyces endolithicus]KAK0928148.1 MutS protein msh4 [Friedmanniomyces endolithicus]KAK0956006.1 MutS protein msh4 [Friedmanniomyces endolithicus]
MAASRRTSTSYTTGTRSTASTRLANRRTASDPYRSTSNPFITTGYNGTTTSRPRAGGRSTARPGTARPSTARPRTGVSTLGAEDQEIICAISESRGISPTVGLAFVNLDTGEAVLSQINDRQTYVLTIHKLVVFNPSNILVVSTAATPKSKLFSIIEDNLEDIGSNLTLLDRRYWAETTGLECIQQLAFAEDAEALKTAVSGNYYAVCCFAAVLKYVERGMARTFPFHSLRIKYEPSEGSMMIDLSTIRSLELVQNANDPKSKACLFGLLNQTLTPMGGRLLRSNILQPLTNEDTLNTRWDALEELSTKEEMFFGVRQALKPFLDVDKTLTQLIVVPVSPQIKDVEQAVNNVIMLKQFVSLIQPVFEALTGARSTMLQEIRSLCASETIEPIRELINNTINEDTTYATQPLDLRNQRTYAVKSGVNGLLDVARLTYKEAMTDALQHMTDLSEEHNLPLQRKFENGRQFYMRLKADELEQRDLPAVFINVYRKKDIIECQTLDLMKRNQKIADAHIEVLMMSDQSVQGLIADVREHMSALFRICEGIAMLDMLSSFAQVVTSQDYVRPTISDTLAIRAGRHPIREKIHSTRYIPNDVYATQQTRFQIITGCNMSGKSTYIRSIALMTVMTQIGSFVPAQFAAFPLVRQLFARVSMDDNIEANVSTFAAEMRETAFILRNIDKQSMAIVDELGRGTSTRDGLAIALAIAEALVESRALVWFATHFRDLANIMAERAGVVNLHLAVDSSERDRMEMLYRIASGTVQEEHYGLKLARVVPLPGDVVEHAEVVARTLELQVRRRKKRSVAVVQARRRKLLLNLREHLVQAKGGRMEGAELTLWLRELQREFVVRMTALDEQAGKAEAGVEEEDDEANDEAADGEVEATATRHSVSPDVRQGSETAMDVERLRKRHARQESSAENKFGEALDVTDESDSRSRRSSSANG